MISEPAGKTVGRSRRSSRSRPRSGQTRAERSLSLSQAASSVGSSIDGLSRALRICVGVASHCLVQPRLEVVAGLGRLHLGQRELGFQLADQA